MQKILGYLALSMLLLACTNEAPIQEAETEEVEWTEDQTYPDGLYCAEIEYYYPVTNTQATYTLEVEIENDYLVKIDFPDGGWLDESHFDAEDISSGIVDFTSDRGAEYTVEITGEGGCAYNSSDYPDEDVFEARLAAEKEEEEEKREHTCPRCGAMEYYLYGDLCSSCKEEEEEEGEEEGDDFY
jgi:hypothetical protein